MLLATVVAVVAVVAAVVAVVGAEVLTGFTTTVLDVTAVLVALE